MPSEGAAPGPMPRRPGAGSCRAGPDAPSTGPDAPLTYAAAGVDIDAGEEAVRLMGPAVESTVRPEVIGGIGGFGGLFAMPTGLPPTRLGRFYRRGRHEACGRRPGPEAGDDRHRPRGDVRRRPRLPGCRTALSSSTTSSGGTSTPTRWPPSWPALPMAAVRPVVRSSVASWPSTPVSCPWVRWTWRGSRWALSNVTAFSAHAGTTRPERAMSWSACILMGLRSNGYSLVRAALLGRAGRSLDDEAWPGAGHSLVDELLRPSLIYTPAVLALLRKVPVRAVAHITGGGLPGNVPRALPPDLDAVLQLGSWPVPPIFGQVQEAAASERCRDGADVQHGPGHGGRRAARNRGRNGLDGCRPRLQCQHRRQTGTRHRPVRAATGACLSAPSCGRNGLTALLFRQLSGFVHVVPKPPLAFPQFIHSGGKPRFSTYSSVFASHAMEPGAPGRWRHHRPKSASRWARWLPRVRGGCPRALARRRE